MSREGATRCSWIVLAAALAVGGCGPTDNLKTYPVRGKVVSQTGELLRGVVQLQPEAGASWSVLGEIQDDGSFVLATVTGDGRKLPGAPAGRYRVLVLVPPSEGRAAKMLRVLQEDCKIEPRNNELPVEVARAPDRR
jgi:hypothetical protein